MTTLKLYKFEVVAICQEIDDDGNVLGERMAGDGGPGELRPFVVFGATGLRLLADSFEARLAEAAQTLI